MRQLRPLPNNFEFAPTLAQRVLQLRDYRNMTVKDLAKLSRFPVKRIEEIEAGMETWLSASDRQLLAKALSVEPSLLQEVERRYTQLSEVPRSVMADLADDILHGARDLQCPVCGRNLRCSVQEGLDLEGRPIVLPKAFCTKCPFILQC